MEKLNNINPNDITYVYSTVGYTLFYKNIPIGCAGTLKKRGCFTNLKLFKQAAEIEKNRILNGITSPDIIKKIQSIKKNEVQPL